MKPSNTVGESGGYRYNRAMIHRPLVALAGLALALLLAFFALRSSLALSAPFQLEYQEGGNLVSAREMVGGHLPYKPIAPMPWGFSVYTPGYLALCALLLKLTPTMPWLGGRLLSLLSAVALAALIYASAARRSRGAALGAALLWLVSPYLFRWATFYRPDLFALLWSAVGIWLIQIAYTKERPTLLPVAALAFVASFYSKQSFFAAPLAATLWLLLVRRAWLWRLLVPGALAGLVVGGALWATSGGALLDNLVAANANAFSWAAVGRFYRAFAQTVPILIALGIAGAALSRRRETMLIPLYALLALLVSLSIGKAGAWENYFLEPLWVLCVLAAGALSQLATTKRAWIAPLLVLLQAMLFLPGFERHTPQEEIAWFRATRSENEALHRAIDDLPQDALIVSETMGPLAEANRPVPLQSFVYTQLARQGLWDETPLVSLLAGGEAARLVHRWDAVADPLARDRWSRAMLDAGERGYALGDRVGEWRVRPPLPFPTADQPLSIGEGISLVNWMLTTEDGAPVSALSAGTPVRVHLLLRTEREQAVPLSVSAQLFAPDGTRVAQDDAMLRQNEGLGGAWPSGALLRDEHLLTLPSALPSGDYTMLVAVYETESGTGYGSVTVTGLRVP